MTASPADAKPARVVEYATWNGGLWRAAVTSYNGFNKEELPVDEETLRVILAAEPGVKIPYNNLVARNDGLNFTNYRGLKSSREKMTSLAFTLKDNPAREIIDDGGVAANRQAARIVDDIVLIGGMVWQRSLGPRWFVSSPYNSPPQVVAIDEGGYSVGYLQFGPGRLDDAERMALLTAGRGIRHIPPTRDRIEILDDAAVRRDEVIVTENKFDGTWSNVGELLNGLRVELLVRWRSCATSNCRCATATRPTPFRRWSRCATSSTD